MQQEYDDSHPSLQPAQQISLTTDYCEYLMFMNSKGSIPGNCHPNLSQPAHRTSSVMLITNSAGLMLSPFREPVKPTASELPKCFVVDKNN